MKKIMPGSCHLNSITTSKSPFILRIEKDKNIALFPGSFKPPHAAHFAAIEFLLSNPNIDCLVIVISNRSRRLPATHLGFDAQAAKLLFEKIIGFSNLDRERIRIEIASHRAIDHALTYFGKVKPQSKLYFCLGSADAQAGDSRFNQLNDLSQQYGVAAEIITLPVAMNPVRATALRAALAGELPDQFLRGLPTWLDSSQKLEIWALASSLSRSLEDIRSEKIKPFLACLSDGPGLKYSTSLDDSSNPQFHVTNTAGEEIVIKYGGDELSSKTPHQNACGDCPERIGIERRAIKRLKPYLESTYKLPRLIKYDKRQRILATNLGGGETLGTQLERGEIDLGIATNVGRLLHQLHTIPEQESPLWESFEQELNYVRFITNSRYETALTLLPQNLARLVKSALYENEEEPRRFISHMKYSPGNIIVQTNNTLLLSGLDKCVTVGDGAIDIAEMVFHYLILRFRHDDVVRVRLALERFFVGYSDELNSNSLPSAQCVVAHLILLLAKSGVMSQKILEALEKILNSGDSINDAAIMARIPTILN